jgi:hypothetical protein
MGLTNPGRLRNIFLLQDSQTCSGAQQASCLMGTEAHLRVKHLGREADYESPSSAEVKNMSTALILPSECIGKTTFLPQLYEY